jgi:hypothetical protein
MNELSVLAIGATISSLHGLSCRCAQIEKEHGKGTPADPELRESVLRTLREVKQLGISESRERRAAFKCRSAALSAGSYIDKDPNVTTIRNYLTMLINTIMDDVSSFSFLWIVPNRRHHLDAKMPFDKLGESKVHDAFPSATEEFTAAGNCLATECGTACVFHLMRGVEFGLRALARDRRIRIPKNKPLELATWEEIIKELEAAETAIKGYPKTLAREAQYDFYHGAMMQFRGFKNVFRNQIMHTRKSYDSDHAQSIFNQTREFMQTLASRITEDTRTPKIWKGKKWITAV